MFVPLTPIRFLHRAVELFGSKTGVISGDRSFTYAEFGDRVGQLATGLRKIGVAPGDRVAYLSFNTHQLLEGYYGVPQAKAIVMPLNVRLSVPEITNILNHADARLLLFENDFAPMISTLRKDCPGIERFITLDAPVEGADMTIEDVLALGHPERADIFDYDEMSIAELFYTSGSTGTPKGVSLAHRTLYLHALDAATLFKDVETMVDLHTIPLFHANGWGRPQCSTMMGLKQVMVRRFEPAAVFSLVSAHRATHMSLVPTMANALINFPDRDRYDISSLKQVTIGGAANSPELVARVEKILGCECLSGYGLTETAPCLTTSRHKGSFSYADEPERRRYQAMAGWPIPGVEVRVVGPAMQDVPRDMKSIGEIIARGDHIMDGYFREPDQTAAVMTDGWFHSGDMAVWDTEGYIHIVDRKKEIIISGGENISSLEVEKAIFAHHAVFECAVVAAPDEQWGEVPAAIVVTKPEAALTEEELLCFLKERLSKFKLPRIIQIQTEALPKTGTGKIRKMILKEQFWAGKEKEGAGMMLPIALAACEALAQLTLPNTVIDKAETVASGEFQTMKTLPPFCRVAGSIRPSSGSDIRFEVWMPASGWNGKFQGIGNGGYAGTIGFGGLGGAIKQGYAAASTDTGHPAGSGIDASWALHHPEKIIDYGHRAIHETAVKGKAITTAFYGSAPKRCYFNSCSNGGRQALMEAQRYPEDYDGIVAGAPANNFTALLSSFVWGMKAILTEPGDYIPMSKLPAIQAATLAACDAADKVKDEVIEVPSSCKPDLDVLRCQGTETDSCLTVPQLTALKKFYTGPINAKGRNVFPGFSAGGEADPGGWGPWIFGKEREQSAHFGFGTQLFKNMVYSDPDWDYRKFDVDRDMKAAETKMGPILNATDPNLKPFLARGGKLILYHGWCDAAIPAQSTIDYYRSVEKKIGAKSARSGVRFFLAPGVQHCGGGAGPNVFGQAGPTGGEASSDVDAALERWVEQGVAPERIIATRRTAGKVERTRPLCAFPTIAHYKGAGSTDDAANFECAK